MGHGLEKMINRGKKLAIQVAEGKKRPDVPLQAAKLASETSVALREPAYLNILEAISKRCGTGTNNKSA